MSSVARSLSVLLICCVAGSATSQAPTSEPTGAAGPWLTVGYSELIDRRQLSHSGESVGALLERLGERPLPPPGGDLADRNGHIMLEPLVEPYGFVLPDALDSLDPVREPPWIEVGSLWEPGRPQPAWVELLHARRYVVESDGAGNFRAILPWPSDPADQALPAEDTPGAAAVAMDAAWPVLRLVLAAERHRLAQAGDPAPELSVEVHAYRHLPERSEFQLGSGALYLKLTDFRSDGRRPPLVEAELVEFLESGLLLEGARLDREGRLRLLGSRSASPPTILGRPLELADLAVAYRAVFHGGLSEPYMSLDRGHAPQVSVVNYGGRLRDTSMGLVSLLCDIRFKTFSLGLDIVEGRDVRDEIRRSLPGFRTHMERLAADPTSEGVDRQQTRLWFYPDNVDLVLSAQDDVLVLRRVRMSAASERVGETGLTLDGGDRPWTRDTIVAINDDYDALAAFFPELADLDQVVRLLSLFAWLQLAEEDGLLLPDLDRLLDVELPQITTPRLYPQLLAFNALPPAAGDDPVRVYDRVPVGEALDRLDPVSGRPLPAVRRYQRAVGALDPKQADHAALLQDLQGRDVERLDEAQLDMLAQRAERLRMHHTVILTLEMGPRREVGERIRAGEQLRIFSVGIGGLDLGMGKVVARAKERGTRLSSDDATAGDAATLVPAAPVEPRAVWRDASVVASTMPLPPHGAAGRSGSMIVETGTGRSGAVDVPEDARWILTVYDAAGPEVRSRRLILGKRGRATLFERVERMRLLRYRLERNDDRLDARLLDGGVTAGTPAESSGVELPPGLVLLVVGDTGEALLESTGVVLRLESRVGNTPRILEAEFPRSVLQRVVLGRDVDTTPGQPLRGLSPLPAPLGEVQTLMALPDPALWEPPWERAPGLLPGEEDPRRLALALQHWWGGQGEAAPAAVVGIDRAASPARWSNAPRPGRGSLLLLPPDAFTGPQASARDELAAAWPANRVVAEPPASSNEPLVVLISAEPPGVFGDRLEQLARDPRMRGKLLAGWSLSGPIRGDLARSLLAAGQLAGVGLAQARVVGRRDAAQTIRTLEGALQDGAGAIRVERLRGPFLWYF